ncbi:hypothetical protein HBR94_10510 [Pseudomonas sp. WS 5412]|uniref:hypothetical protein n=1 Tax=Pseudomonas sp. WS 5412 TaxID=2717487 RepID=UPI0014738C01|nr:hypothetical protein [Pseudomonas sp. WS 5412]NMY31930.1 hypothetical protein [Pseudomonas sp. WS 5412]
MAKTIDELIISLQAVLEAHGGDLQLKGITGETSSEYRRNDAGEEELYAIRFPSEKN